MLVITDRKQRGRKEKMLYSFFFLKENVSQERHSNSHLPPAVAQIWFRLWLCSVLEAEVSKREEILTVRETDTKRTNWESVCKYGRRYRVRKSRIILTPEQRCVSIWGLRKKEGIFKWDKNFDQDYLKKALTSEVCTEEKKNSLWFSVTQRLKVHFWLLVLKSVIYKLTFSCICSTYCYILTAFLALSGLKFW